MATIVEVPISAITALSAEQAVTFVRTLLRAECGYAKASPAALTISSRLTTADGGIDAEISLAPQAPAQSDSLLREGLTGFQIKSGSSFKPWTKSSIDGELLDSHGNLYSEVRRLVERRGRYVLMTTGHDLTPEQRNRSRKQIANVLNQAGFPDYEGLIDVLGASQLGEFAERYPGTTALLSVDLSQDAWALAEWERDAHLINPFEPSPEQDEAISRIRTGLLGNAKHIRILGEPGLGKTRLVLEAVRDPNIAPYVLYFQHGARFGQTGLFRLLLRSGWSTPLVIVLDELPEFELAELWRSLKPRCGQLKIVTIDHGRDQSHDVDIDRIQPPRLSDETIQKILVGRIGDVRGVERWVEICEGSPRVAQAVADNLSSNPGDLLRPPSTIPLWTRFLHGYGSRNDGPARQLDCVAQHLALFSRFGYEDPVSEEAAYISTLVQKIDPTIGWARFQEIVHDLRSRRVLQGSRTLFFVPRALHIHLWRQFWETYGRGFDFVGIFKEMPESLQSWFLSRFRFADDQASLRIVEGILARDGIFSDRTLLTSENGSRFLSTLAEASPSAVLKLLESTVGTWSNDDLLAFVDHRQNIVWALEKIAVWPPYTVRALRLLGKLAANENASNSNNSIGTLTDLFKIGPEHAVTEASPEQRLPAFLELLRSTNDSERRIALKIGASALETSGQGYRIVGPEYQGLKERANLWTPKTYGEWWDAYHLYFQTLVNETSTWAGGPEVCHTLLNVVREQLRVPPSKELALSVLRALMVDPMTAPSEMNHFFANWLEYRSGEDPDIDRSLRKLSSEYARRDLSSRFRRYVLDVDWLEWDQDFRERHSKTRNRAQLLTKCLARRIAKDPVLFDEIEALVPAPSQSPALFYFGQQLCENDVTYSLLPRLTRTALETKQVTCISGYLSVLRTRSADIYRYWTLATLDHEGSAWLGADVALATEYDEEVFGRCLGALRSGWIGPRSFWALRYGRNIETIPEHHLAGVFQLLTSIGSREATNVAIELLDSDSFSVSFPCPANLVFQLLVDCLQSISERAGTMESYHWKGVCQKLLELDAAYGSRLLDEILLAMGREYRLSYESYVVAVANEIVIKDPSSAWKVISLQFEASLPRWRSDIFQWLKGGLTTFDDAPPRAAIALLPEAEIVAWIQEDPDARAGLIAHTVPSTLDDEHGGRLTRELLTRWGTAAGVQSGISATFHSGGWTGLASIHLRKKREKFREWLSRGYSHEVSTWIESEIDYLDRRIEGEEISEERDRFD